MYTKKKVHAPKIFIFIPQIYIHMFDQQRKSISKGCGSRNFYFKFPQKKKNNKSRKQIYINNGNEKKKKKKK